MKAGEQRAGRTASQETWQSAPLTDNNAALWASITPPADPSLQTLIRRRIEALSLDLLAQRLWLRFPGYFSSRATAQRSILGAAFALGAGLGLAGYLAVTALTADPAPVADSGAAPARTAKAQVSTRAASASRTAAEGEGARMADSRATEARAGGHVGASLAGMTGAATLAATVAPSEPEQAVQALTPSDSLDEPQPTHHKAKRASATKKKAKAKARAKATSRRGKNSRARALANALGIQ
jgi:hypothetical protein